MCTAARRRLRRHRRLAPAARRGDARGPAAGAGRCRRAAADARASARSPRTRRLLVKMSYLFGPEVEDYRTLLTQRDDGARDGAGDLHGDQHGAGLPAAAQAARSAADGRRQAAGAVSRIARAGTPTRAIAGRRPTSRCSTPSTPVARERGQTIFAVGPLAYDALPADLKARVETLQGLHASRAAAAAAATGRQDAARRRCRTALAEAAGGAHASGHRRKALYLCERGQMDWFDGPFVGMEPGPYGEGAGCSTN